MVFNNVLKVNYSYDGKLVFKHFVGNGFKPEVELKLTEDESLRLLEKIRESLREGNNQSHINVGCYDIEIASYGAKAFSVLIMECAGEMSRPLGMFKYDKYMLGKSVVEGITSAIREIREYME